MKKNTKTYALYKGDTFITLGTIQEIATNQKVKPETIAYMNTPAYHKKTEAIRNPNRKILIEVEEEI